MFKRAVAILILAGSTAQAITTADVKNVKIASDKIVTASLELMKFADYVAKLDGDNYQFSVKFSSDVVNMTAQQKLDLVSSYNALKAQLTSAVSTLP